MCLLGAPTAKAKAKARPVKANLTKPGPAKLRVDIPPRLRWLVVVRSPIVHEFQVAFTLMECAVCGEERPAGGACPFCKSPSSGIDTHVEARLNAAAHVQETANAYAQPPDVLDLGLRFVGQHLEGLDGATARQAREELAEWVGLTRPILTGSSPWTGAKVETEEDAQEVLSQSVRRRMSPTPRSYSIKNEEEKQMPRR